MGRPPPQIVREAQAATTTPERMISQKEEELAKATVERKRAVANLAVARLQVRIDETTDEVDELKQEKELILGGDDDGLSSTFMGASLDSAALPSYDGGRPQSCEVLDRVLAAKWCGTLISQRIKYESGARDGVVMYRSLRWLALRNNEITRCFYLDRK
jgi:hypothetical protein